MAETEPNSFEDPGLKAAIRRAWGEERCPDALRARVRESMAADGPGPVPISRSRWSPRRPLAGLAWAAIVLIAVALVLKFSRSTGHHDVAVGPLPASLSSELVERHDKCCAAPDHHMPGLSRDNFAEIQKELHQKLGFPILSADPTGGWQFHGGSICRVGDTPSGHLVFQRGKEFVSLFSLPHQFVAGVMNSGDCLQIASEHPMAGFVTPNGFYCIVGSSSDGSLTLEQVRSMRDDLRGDVARAASPPALRLTLADSR